MRAIARHLALGILTGGVAALLGLLPIGELVELKSYDLLQGVRRADRPPEDIVIVAIDEPSFAEIGRQWPWPRRLHGQLAETLRREGAAAVGFDILFPEASSEEDDRLFAESIRRAGNVVLASAIEMMDDPRFAAAIVVEPLAILGEAATMGVATIPLDRDLVARRFPPLDGDEPTFAAEVARVSGKPIRAIPPGAYLSFAGPPRTIPTFSYYQALDPARSLPKGTFAGKIVLVGRAAGTSPEPQRSAPDTFATPWAFSRGSGLMSGVEIHATVVDNLLRGRFVIRVAGAPAVLIAFGLGLAGSLLQVRWRPVRSALLTVLAFGAYGAAAILLFARAGLWIPLLPAAVAAAAPYGGFAVVSYLQSEKKRRAIRRAFAHYLSPSILREVLQDPERLRLGGEEVEATFLFSDIAGFTGISEGTTPEGVVRFLNRYFSEMTAIVFAHRGTVDKFVGDALVAFWGAPVPDPDGPANACRAAVAMQARMETLREEMAGEGLPRLHIRIGINTGRAIVGNMGSRDLFNYSALGDAVNLASRLESANKETHTSILISKAVRDRAGAAIAVRPLGAIAVRGKSAQVEVFELVGLAGE